ncbi:MAG TPA: hypothetical protein VGZ22_17650, partial [Isosphaeraceae bacterium]|nr:hypothetical protein [Isosphaeraceae bacterium]
MATRETDASSATNAIQVSTSPFAVSFVVFGLGLVWALLAAEATQDLRLFRTIYAIRVALVL